MPVLTFSLLPGPSTRVVCFQNASRIQSCVFSLHLPHSLPSSSLPHCCSTIVVGLLTCIYSLHPKVYLKCYFHPQYFTHNFFATWFLFITHHINIFIFKLYLLCGFFNCIHTPQIQLFLFCFFSIFNVFSSYKNFWQIAKSVVNSFIELMIQVTYNKIAGIGQEI